jgi:hypothetical protein
MSIIRSFKEMVRKKESPEEKPQENVHLLMGQAY